MRTTDYLVFDFNKDTDPSSWRVVDDVVMGGRSSGDFTLDENGNGVFYGLVSLENNGGFSSVRYFTSDIQVGDYTKMYIRLKGDGKNYQFRLKTNVDDYYSFVTIFKTSGEWQEIEIPLKDMYPSFRGQRLRRPNFNDDHFEQIGFLIANKRDEAFRLVIDEIRLK